MTDKTISILLILTYLIITITFVRLSYLPSQNDIRPTRYTNVTIIGSDNVKAFLVSDFLYIENSQKNSLTIYRLSEKGLQEIYYITK